MKRIFLSFCCILIFSFAVYADESLIQIKQKLEKIERDITDLQKILFTKKDNQLSDNNEDQHIDSKITVFDMRLRDIENELQAINLNYESISFEIEDFKDTLEKLTLELNDSILELNNAIISINTKIDNKNVELNDSDVLSSTQAEQKDTLGTLTVSSNDLSELNNVNNNENKISYSSPEEQFQVALDNLRGQRFEEAKSNLELFIKDHSSHVLAGSAHYWLGEIFFLQKEYREAALIFAEGYQKYPDSAKSPNNLYKLAETLIKIEKKVEACNTLNQFILNYPSNQLIEKSELTIKELQCS